MAAALLLATATATAWGPECSAQTNANRGSVQSSSNSDPLTALQDAVTTTIAQSERSVVAIRRYAKPPAARGAANRTNGRGRIVIGQPADPLAALRRRVQPPPTGYGAGVVIGPDTILTQYLAIGVNEDHTVITVDGGTHEAELIAADPRSSLAVLRVLNPEASGFEAPALRLGRAEELKKGRFVIAIGNPFSIESDGQPTTSWGVVSNTARRAPRGERLLREPSETDEPFRTTLHHFGALLQTDARLGWNASGGALVTLDGQLIGILTTAAAIAGHESPAGYAIPLNETMRRVVGTLVKGGEPEYGLLGIRFEAPPSAGGDGVVVSEAYAPGPAGRSGLQQGDVIEQIAEKAITDALSLQLTVGSRAPGDEVAISYRRGGKPLETTVRLGKAYIEGPKVVSRRRPSWQGLWVDFPTAVPAATLAEKVSSGHLDPEGCVVVSEVEPESVSWRLGVRPFVYISHVDGQRVSTPDEFYAAVEQAPNTARLKFTKPLPNARKKAARKQL